MKYIIITLLLFLVSCAEPPKKGDQRKVTMRILNIDPPKHVYVDLVNVITGEKWYHVYVSKHCNAWRDIPFEAELTMTEYSYDMGNRKYRELDGHEVYERFCR
jgi:hypothetical protein